MKLNNKLNKAKKCNKIGNIKLFSGEPPDIENRKEESDTKRKRSWRMTAAKFQKMLEQLRFWENPNSTTLKMHIGANVVYKKQIGARQTRAAKFFDA